MRPLAACLSVALLACFVSGCPSPKPFQGINASKFARLNEHRLLGMSLLENGGSSDAAAEFKAMASEEPKLGFAYVNQAVALLRTPGQEQPALDAARKGAELLPKAAWPKLVLARAHQALRQTEEAGKALEAAVQAEPNNLRMVGALVRHLEILPGDHSQRLSELRARLAELAPDNLVAQANNLQAQLERKEFAEAGKTLARIKTILPQLPEQAREPLQKLEQLIGASSPEAGVMARQLSNTLKISPLYSAHQNLLYGNDQDPADLAMRDWGVPVPAITPPAPPAVTVTWKEVTEEVGLTNLSLTGIAPVAIGDVDPVPEEVKPGGKRQPAILGRPDLFTSLADGLFLSKADGKFHSASEGITTRYATGIAFPGSPLLADLNNDYALDVYIARPGGDEVLRNIRSGIAGESGIKFGALGVSPNPLLPAAKTAGRGAGTALAVDLDQDGDLDLVRASSDPAQPAVRYLRNNGNFSFTDLTAQSGLKASSQGARQSVFGDFDRDGDPDLFVTRSEAGPLLFLNRRQDRFQEASAAWGLKSDAGSLSATVADFDRDGDWDVAVVGKAPHGTLLYRNTGARFEADPAALSASGSGDASSVEVIDYDNDSWLDLAVAGADGVKLLHNQQGRFTEAVAVASGPATWVKSLDHDQDGDLDLLYVDGSGKLHLMSNEGGNGRPWMKVELQGLLKGGSQSNNSYAVGAVIEPLTAWDQQPLLVTEPVTHVGLGAATRVVALRTTWTNGVPLDAIAPPTQGVFHYDQPPTGSCPFLYTWDGSEWQFHSDFNWRSPLGMLAARGVSVPHEPTTDWVKIPGERMAPVNGYLPLIATEELREISYFDEIRLLAVDHPADTEVFLDERMKFGPPDPYQVYTVRHRRLPVSARDGEGHDLSPALRNVDNVYTPVPAGPFRGVRTAHDLILDLGPVADPKDVRLFLNGWIFPAANSTNIAVSQNPEIRVIPPTLYVGDGKGGWVEADRTVGLPCGKRKTVVLDLSGKLRGADHRVKLTTTMEIRWDAAFFTSGETAAPVTQTEAPLVQADLRERGYGTPYREVPEGPYLYDYQRPLRENPSWGNMAGAYTKLGDCAELLRGVDDRYAIVGPGDEVRLMFSAHQLPPLPQGWKRDFVLRSDGWTKDSDKNTVSGETVGPLPFHGMKRYPYGADEHFPDDAAHRAWKREWNTRLKGGYSADNAVGPR